MFKDLLAATMSQIANSSSQSLQPLEAVWLEHMKLTKLATESAKGKKGFDHVFWIGYRRALRDIGSSITNQILNDLLNHVERGGSHGNQTLQSQGGLHEMQELPDSKD